MNNHKNPTPLHAKAAGSTVPAQLRARAVDKTVAIDVEALSLSFANAHRSAQSIYGRMSARPDSGSTSFCSRAGLSVSTTSQVGRT